MCFVEVKLRCEYEEAVLKDEIGCNDKSIVTLSYSRN